MTKEGFTKIVTFMTPGAGVLVLGCGHISHIVKMHCFLKNLFLYSHSYIRQTKYIVMMTKERSTKILTFMTSGAGVLLLGCGHISHIVKMHYLFKKSSSLLPGIDQANYVYSDYEQGRVYQNCYLHDPRGRGFLCKGVAI